MPPSKKNTSKSVGIISNPINVPKPLDNFFGVVIEKPPSPITVSSIIESVNQNININNNNNQVDSNEQAIETDRPTGGQALQNVVYSLTDIKNKIEKLSENEIFEVFKIIKNNTEKYSTNKSWILVNLSTLKKSTIKELSNFIYFCENNNRRIDEEEQNRDVYREIVAE
jgi:hypothetical protein